ncbi:hypothetical protein SAMN03159475_2280 [Pseudomonas sp. NFPP33]|nr:hypothetical protein SAMN03159475_2280 [Pseudomonas sp. NFPP33]
MSQVIRCAHPFGAALKRVQLRCRVQVAEPNSKTQPSAGFFIACGLSPGTASQVIRFAHPFGAALKRVQLRCRAQVAEPNSKAQPSAGLFIVCGFSPGIIMSQIIHLPEGARCTCRIRAPRRIERTPQRQELRPEAGLLQNTNRVTQHPRPAKTKKAGQKTGPDNNAARSQLTLSLSRFFSSVASPIPFTSNNSSTEAKLPCSSR